MSAGSPTTLQPPHYPLEISVGGLLDRFHFVVREKPQYLIRCEEAMPREMQMLNALSSAFVRKPSRRNAENRCGFLYRVSCFLETSALFAHGSGYNNVGNARSQELLEVPDS